jgi:hypothetical protein
MSDAVNAAETYLADLERGVVAPRDKPTAFQHWLITSLVAEAKERAFRLDSACDVWREMMSDAAPEAHKAAAKWRRYTPCQVSALRDLARSGVPVLTAAKRIGMARATARRILSGQSYVR